MVSWAKQHRRRAHLIAGLCTRGCKEGGRCVLHLLWPLAVEHQRRHGGRVLAQHHLRKSAALSVTVHASSMGACSLLPDASFVNTPCSHELRLSTCSLAICTKFIAGWCRSKVSGPGTDAVKESSQYSAQIEMSTLSKPAAASSASQRSTEHHRPKSRSSAALHACGVSPHSSAGSAPVAS